MHYDQWEATACESMQMDPLWRTRAYKLALYMSDCVTEDARRIAENPATRSILPQLTLAVASIGANIAEGYSRTGPRDRARFFEYALGSAREARHWIFSVRGAIEPDVVAQRAATLDEIIRLLVTMVVRQRSPTPNRR